MLKERYTNVFANVSENLSYLNSGTVSLDIDAVTQATYVLALNKVGHILGKAVHKEQLITYWELANIARLNGIPEDKTMDFARSAWNDENVYLNAPVMPGILTLLNIFNEVGTPYIFISSRPAEFEEVTKKWFSQNIPFVKSESIILGRQEGVSGGDFKSRMIKEFGVVLHIEDAVEEAVKIVEATPAKIIIVPQPWNEARTIQHPRIKYLGNHIETKGVWPVVRYLASNEARNFLALSHNIHVP